MLIKHHGMHWERYTFFKEKYKILGIPFGKGSANNNAVDFTQHTGVYVLEDMLQHPVYIGHADKLGKRLEDHVKKEHTHNSWDYFSWFSVTDTDDVNSHDNSVIDLVVGIESILIRFLNPRLNKKEESLGDPYWQKSESIHTLNGLMLSLLENYSSGA